MLSLFVFSYFLHEVLSMYLGFFIYVVPFFVHILVLSLEEGIGAACSCLCTVMSLRCLCPTVSQTLMGV